MTAPSLGAGETSGSLPDFPTGLLIEPSTMCNLQCPLCISGSGRLIRARSLLDFGLYAGLVGEVQGHVQRFTFHGQGEPFIHPRLTDMVRLASESGIRTHVSTNGHFLDAKICGMVIAAGLTSLSVSVDGATPDTYRIYRVGGDFQRVRDGIERLLAMRDSLGSSVPRVQLQFLVLRHNEHEIDAIRRLAEGLGVDALRLKSAQVFTPEQAQQYLPSDSSYRRYVETGELQIRSSSTFECWYLDHQPTITADGAVVPCCFDKNSKFEMGRLQDEPFTSIWRSFRYGGFRRLVRGDRGNFEMCRNCTEGLEIPFYTQEDLTSRSTLVASGCGEAERFGPSPGA